MSVVYHLTTGAEWERALREGSYRADSLATEGFIHCSTAAQHAATANRFYAGRTDLVLLLIDTTRLTSELRYEEASHGGSFPHIYGPLNVDAVFECAPYAPGADGTFDPYDEASGFEMFDGVSLGDVSRRARSEMADFEGPWAIAGGWALDLFLGAQGRPHADLELVVRYADQRALHEHLRGWDLRVATGPGVIEPWDGSLVEAPRHQIWARRGTDPAPTWREFVLDPTMLDFLLEPSEGDTWIFRRDGSIRLPATEMMSRAPDGTPYVRPEVVLLFKAAHARYKDGSDLRRTLPRMDARARAWLRDAVARAHPGHAWLGVLDA